MPTPSEAAAILRAHFGMVQEPGGDPETMVGDPTGSIALAGIRGTQQSELEDRIANEAAATQMAPSEGFVPGEPGRRYRTQGMSPANLVADRLNLRKLMGDQANDPFTGDAETARVGGIQHALDTAATIQRPEIGDASHTLATRAADAAKLLKLGELQAAGSPEAYKAAMVPVRVAGSGESQDVLDAGARRAADVARAAHQQPIKYTAAEQQILDKANEVQELGPQLMTLLEQDYPGIGNEPGKYGSVTDKLFGMGGGWLYRQGMTSTPNKDRITQKLGYLEAAIPRILNSGRLNQQQYNDLKLHAPAIGYSAGANYERVKTILTDILPAVLHGIDEGHGANPTSTALPGADPWANVPPPDQLKRNPYEVNR